MSAILKLGKETIIYGTGQALTKLIGVITLPLLTGFLIKEQMGELDVLSTVQTILSTILMLGVDTAITFYFWEHKDDTGAQKGYVSTGFMFTLLLSSLAAAVLLAIMVIVGLPKGLSMTIILIAALHIPNLTIFHMLAKLFRIFRKPKLFISLTVSVSVLNVTMLYVFLVVLKLGLLASVLSQFVVLLMGNLASILYFRKYLFAKPRLSALGQLLAYGAPLIVISIMDQLVAGIQRPMLIVSMSVATLGVFSVASRIASAVGIATKAFTLAWGPFAMSIKNDANAGMIYGNISKYFLWMGSFAVLCIQALSPFLVGILSSSEYESAIPIVPILALGLIFQSMYGVHAVGLNITKKTYFISVGVVISLVLSTFLTYVLTPSFGMAGAACAMVLAYISTNVIIILIGRKFYYIAYDGRSLAAIAVCFLPMFAWGEYVQMTDPGYHISLFVMPFIFLGSFLIVERRNVAGFSRRFLGVA